MVFGEPFGGLIPGARRAVLSALPHTGAPLTGRQVHGLVSDEHSLWSVQEALKALTRLGLVETQSIGRAGVHTINEGHAAVAHLCALADPIALLRAAIAESVGSEVESVIVFGSIARGEASEAATSTWPSSPAPGGTDAPTSRTPCASAWATAATSSSSRRASSCSWLDRASPWSATYAGTCPRIRFSRTGTLGTRADRCDFCLEIIAPTPAHETREAA